ncbi:MAG: MarR family transcriptional regulator [Thermoplasmatales archaeon]|jgi:DNA-binding MarR family transcriptional regulator|nr:MarR family transcriptional regulator [Candidatus Thermoplasmatota archaeon]MCL6002692.1 MarR family transcriptional regulator [Candidatus Thermoplasmatota archaeon]MDA8054362.1 MarR family transcriptional regulator [Thermoplasmatales archaeon]
MKNVSRTITEVPERAVLVGNFKGMTDDVMIWRYKLLRDEGITRPGLFLMHFVSKKGPLKLTDCSLSLGVSKPTITKIVDNLEKDGYVKRKKELGDRRSYYVHLTDRGKGRLDTINKQLEDVFHSATKELKIEEVRMLNSSIALIRDKLVSIQSTN